ncbi:hypothetical protein LWC34_19510 [Kibdelosporangium philippinense]|uniref:Uncharacterized protein n=1 Tax=Kibdelosporangium philippinense TaxID=211113 RepID=A0ABS8ZBX4_9PSEU|nr:hypothetical protein [Kibdelosporangium philippinense]MCE7004997.1 hypothetical protein [Kibdelosporangium philippinense]
MVFELDPELLDEPDEDAVELDSELDEVWSVICVALTGGGTDEVVPSVATCSSRTGTGLSVRLLVAPTANKAAAAAPRNAPTTIRNGAPRRSSTRYTYRVTPIGSSQTGLFD